MKYRIVIKCDFGIFFSEPYEEAEYEGDFRLISSAVSKSPSSLHFKGENGAHYFFPAKLLEHSVIWLEPVREEENSDPPFILSYT